MRTFIALDIDDAVRERLQLFLDGVRGLAPDARWVHPESMHLTLKFAGEQPRETVEDLKHSLAEVRGSAMQIVFRGYGFFPGAKAARVFWAGVEAEPQLVVLARAVDEATASLGIPREEHTYSPHLTLARRGSGAPAPHRDDRVNQTFGRLQEKLAALPAPEFGTMTAREFFLYESQLLRGGAKYTKLARFALG